MSAPDPSVLVVHLASLLIHRRFWRHPVHRRIFTCEPMGAALETANKHEKERDGEGSDCLLSILSVFYRNAIRRPIVLVLLTKLFQLKI